MKIDGGLGFDPSSVARQASKAEADGYDGVWSAETRHDPFLPIAIGAGATETLEFGTGIAVAFARNPMTLAVLANDLQLLTKGRFMLGLGSQIKPHITKRFSMPWSHPAPRMREMILAIRAIWKTWETGEELAFRGEFYTHTLMTPFFNPGPNPYGNPKILLAGVGEHMTEVAGEVGDGFLVHGFTTERYLREVSLPALERGAAKAGKTRADLTVSYPGFVVTGTDDESTEAADKAVRQQIAFYGSTPAYRPVLELHGWGDLQPELNTLSKRGEWVKMGELIDDDVARRLRRRVPARRGGHRGAQPLRGHGRPLQLLRALQGRPRAVEGRAGRLPRLSRVGAGSAGGLCGRGSDDDVDQAGRPGHDPRRRRTLQRLGHLGRGERRRLGVRLGDAGVHLDAVAHLAVDLDDHGHRLLADQLGVGRRPGLQVHRGLPGVARAPTAPPSRAGSWGRGAGGGHRAPRSTRRRAAPGPAPSPSWLRRRLGSLRRRARSAAAVLSSSIRWATAVL